ncbi:hypothetical protein B0G80_8609 [Paraburkholderia sp. BL6669N2]|uniref:hypothetical protein n=1 Tax=Paraburkholderia sp. BL6669N2 TaxID=1938807 RepID=UPI000E25DC96|nr:hypothetical protein [Paraburkholderia sp. BL6669N2]REG52093.1 hypothetical protein B0G80_8609 [Paraburkholderia sp. BL6669N2]
MTVFELIEILSEVDPKSRVTFLAGGHDAQVAEEIVAVATPDYVWVMHGKSDKKEGEADIHHADKQADGSDAARASTESEAVSVVILSTDEDFLFKAIVRRLMLG